MPKHPNKPIITTQSMLAIESANQALNQHEADKVSRDFEDSTSKIRAHYAVERGLTPPEVTLDLLRQRHAKSRQKPADPS